MNETCPRQALAFEHSVPSWWRCLEAVEPLGSEALLEESITGVGFECCLVPLPAFSLCEVEGMISWLSGPIAMPA